jgi:general secretion pathway protein J
MTNRRIRDEFGDPKAALLASSGRDVMVEFTHTGWSNPANELRSHLQRVAYTVKDNKLYRAYWLVLDRAQDSTPVQTVILDPVKSMEWRFMDNAGNWQTEWPPVATSTTALAPGAPPAATAAPLPRAVEVSLELEDMGRLTRLFMVATERPPNVVPGQPQAGLPPGQPAPGLPPSPSPSPQN